MKVLVSGSSSGIGKFLKKEFNAVPFKRNENKKYGSFDLIIHCAYNLNNRIEINNIDDYLNDTLILTDRLLKIEHKKFIFISTIDVYPKYNIKFDEKTKLNFSDNRNLYSTTKLICENKVFKYANNPLILRCGTLLGEYMRENNIKKLIMKIKKLTLTPNSNFYLTSYSQVYEIIKRSLKNKINGIFNVISKPKIMLKDIANIIEFCPTYGNFKYTVPEISNKLVKIKFKNIKFSSKEIILNYINSLN